MSCLLLFTPLLTTLCEIQRVPECAAVSQKTKFRAWKVGTAFALEQGVNNYFLLLSCLLLFPPLLPFLKSKEWQNARLFLRTFIPFVRSFNHLFLSKGQEENMNMSSKGLRARAEECLRALGPMDLWLCGPTKKVKVDFNKIFFLLFCYILVTSYVILSLV